MVMPFVSAERQVDEQAPSILRASTWLAGIELGWHAPATEADTVRGYEIARERRSQAQRTSTTLMADTGSTETTDTDDSVVAVGYYYVHHMRALRDGATSAWSNEAIIDPAARTFSPAGSGVNLANPREAAAEPTLIGPSTVDYPENSTVPVATYSVSDPDRGVISWSLDGVDPMFFSLIEGTLSFKQPPNYENPADADADNEYEVTVVATDPQGESASLIVTVTVTDVNDPNVVLIMADDAGVELFGAYGSTQYRTPRLDALAALGARFSHAYASPSCTPSRVALMTGRYGVRNYVNFRHLAPTEYTFTDMFIAAGYETAVAGKWHLDGYADRFVIPMPGITAGGGDYRAAAPGQENQLGVSPADSGFGSYCLTITNATGGRKYWQPSIDCNGQISERGARDFGPDIFTDFILSFIESNQDRRFFAYYSMALPHSPFIRPPWRIGHCRDGNDDQCNFEDMVAYLDHNVGRIYDKLSDLDLLGNTVLIFTSDNGTTREIISQLNGQAIAGDKGRPTPGGTNVPLIVLAPGDGARVIDDLIDFTDFLPTLAEVIGFQVPEHVSVDGVSFWDRLQGRAGLPREWIYTFFNPYPYDRDLGHPPVVYVRDKRYQLFKDGLFFDVEADPLLINPLPSDDEDSREARGRLQGVLSQFDSDGDAILWDLVPSRPHLNKHPLWRPVLRSAVVDGNVLTLTYAGTIDTAAVPTAASYTAQVDGTERAVVNVEVSTSTVALTLASAVTSSQSVTVSYTPGKRALRHREREGVGGQPAIPLSSEAVTNESPPNARPLFAWDETGHREVAEGTAAGSAIGAPFAAGDADRDALSYAFSGDDALYFELDTLSGELRTKAALNYESKTEYAFTVSIRDGKDAQNQTDSEVDDELDVTVAVTNVDEDGSLTLSSEQPQVGTELTATLTDPDQVQAVQSWAWERSGNRRDWTGIASETTGSYVPSADTVERFLRVTATYDDGHGTGKVLQKTSSQAVAPAPIVNTAPFFPDGVLERSVTENSAYGTTVGPPVTATDVEDDTLSYTLTRGDTGLFTVDSSSGQLQVGLNTSLDHEDRDSYRVTMTVTDPSGASASKPVSIAVLDINEAPVANNDSAVTDEDIEVSIDVLGNDRDPEDETLTLTSVSNPGKGLAAIGAGNRITYQPNPNLHGVDSFTYTVTDGNRPSSATVSVTIVSTNDPPSFASPRITRSVSEEAQDGDDVGPRVTATDVDLGDVLSYRMSVSSDFAIVAATGQIVVAEGAELNADSRPEHVVTVEATDPDLDEASIEVVITVTAGPDAGASGGGGGGGGGGPPPVPIPSDADFDWNVTRDVEALDGDNDLPTDIWSDGATLWVVENSAGGPDAVFAYRLEDGERVAEFEFGLDSRNRFSHGIWSDGETAWIADSGQDKLFAYDLESGERLQERDLELDGRNRDPRGIWSNRETIFVLDSGKDALFIYDLDSGKLRIEYALVKLNQSPRGIWSDGVTIWISDDGAKRLFAYRIESEMLNRDEDQEFTFRSLLKAGNGDARGIWSDGDVVYVADELDQHVYTYNLPDAIDARLASLSLSDVEINEFSPGQLTYITLADSGATVTTVQAIATQEAATVMIVPADADGDAENGHQITLNAETEISVTVTSSDGSRTKSYRVLVAQPPCLTGLTAERLSEVMFIGGSLDELGRCAREREVAAFFYWTEVSWLLYAPDAPAFLSRQFNQHFEGGIPAGAPLVALSTEEQRTDN